MVAKVIITRVTTRGMASVVVGRASIAEGIILSYYC